MLGETALEADGQDRAETFDETNTTRDGEDIAHPDLARDVYDVTSAQDDGLGAGDDAIDDTDDFDPDEADEAELEFILQSDDGVDEPRSFRRGDGDLVAGEDANPADYEPDVLSRRDLDELGYGETATASPSVRLRERRLDEGLEESFPASDPIAINPGAD